jgi:hypothetical protein
MKKYKLITNGAIILLAILFLFACARSSKGKEPHNGSPNVAPNQSKIDSLKKMKEKKVIIPGNGNQKNN